MFLYINVYIQDILLCYKIHKRAVWMLWRCGGVAFPKFKKVGDLFNFERETIFIFSFSFKLNNYEESR